ncbi:MAG: hypothetical protein WAL73_09295, partial [Terracidiphilus sp.]
LSDPALAGALAAIQQVPSRPASRTANAKRYGEPRNLRRFIGSKDTTPLHIPASAAAECLIGVVS